MTPSRNAREACIASRSRDDASCQIANPDSAWDPSVSSKFDSVLLVLLDENFDATAIYEADRQNVLATLFTPGSKARNERGTLGVAKFKAIGRLRWRAE